MQTESHTRLQLVALIAGAALFAYAGSTGFAQTAATTGKPAAARPATASKPATAAKRAVPANTGTQQLNSDYWLVNSDLGSQYSRTPTRANEMPEVRPNLGRVPLQTGPGSVGLTATSETKAGQFYDGRPVPGLASGTRKDTEGYVGLSLSVPSLNKNLALPTPWNRYE